MSLRSRPPSKARREAQFRHAVIGGLLADPPGAGELGARLDALAARLWRQPDGSWSKVGRSTIERWFYLGRDADDPLAALTRARRKDAGQVRVMAAALLTALAIQYAAHKGWSYKLHVDNLAVLCEEEPDKYGQMPSYSTVRRRMLARGWVKHRVRRRPTPGQRAAAERLEQWETRSFEVSAVHALWHYDFHQAHRKVADRSGEWHKPVCLCILDDCSRLCCHIQWYLVEATEEMVHGLQQAMCKRGLPRGTLHDNGGAMMAAETLQGLSDLSIDSNNTLPYSPQQNGKQEKFWDLLEGRLMAMLERVDPLTLDVLNYATQAWAEMEYNRARHDELGMSPIDRMLLGPDVSRKAPSLLDLQRAFCVRQRRTQRRSDCTISIEGVRVELPSRLRTLRKVTVRFARWDLSKAWVVDDDTDAALACIKPLDKAKNADGRRRVLAPLDNAELPTVADDHEPLPPLMRKLMSDYAATGLLPAYLPKD